MTVGFGGGGGGQDPRTLRPGSDCFRLSRVKVDLGDSGLGSFLSAQWLLVEELLVKGRFVRSSRPPALFLA